MGQLMHILMVLTSHDRLGDTGEKTGFWLEEFAAPYYVFKDAGAQLMLASPRGGQPVGFVCHAPGVLRHVRSDGKPLVAGRQVTGFSDSEEAAVGLTKVVPFLVEDELKRLGGRYEKGPDFSSFVRVDGRLVTGQNPASSVAVARVLLDLLMAPGTARNRAASQPGDAA